MPGPPLIDYDEFVRIEGQDGQTLILYTDIDRLEQHMLELAPEDGERIAGFAKALRAFSRLKMPQTKAPELAGRLDGIKMMISILPYADDLDDVSVIGELTHSKEEFSAFFCSEWVAAGLETGGAIRSLNCSEVTPLDLVQFAIYQGTYYQIKGSKTLLPGYNTVSPEGWGE